MDWGDWCDERPIGQGESSNRRKLKTGKCEGLWLIYATFHPTIKIMDGGIDSVGDVAMAGLSGWEKREFRSLSFADAVRKPFAGCARVDERAPVHVCASLRSASVLAARLFPPLWKRWTPARPPVSWGSQQAADGRRDKVIDSALI